MWFDSFSLVFQRRDLARQLLEKYRGKLLVAGIKIRETKRQRHLSGGLLLFLVIHFLSLCTLSPQVHAELLYQAAWAHHTSAGHCTLPSSAPKPLGPFSPTQSSSTTPAQRSGTIPVCCTLVNLHRATIVSPIQLDTPPFPFLFSLRSKTTPLAGEMQLFRLVLALHPSRPPPLYLLHTALLI